MFSSIRTTSIQVFEEFLFMRLMDFCSSVCTCQVWWCYTCQF